MRFRCCCLRFLSAIFFTSFTITSYGEVTWCQVGLPSCQPSRFSARFNCRCSAFLANTWAAFTSRPKIARSSSSRKSNEGKTGLQFYHQKTKNAFIPPPNQPSATRNFLVVRCHLLSFLVCHPTRVGAG